MSGARPGSRGGPAVSFPITAIGMCRKCNCSGNLPRVPIVSCGEQADPRLRDEAFGDDSQGFRNVPALLPHGLDDDPEHAERIRRHPHSTRNHRFAGIRERLTAFGETAKRPNRVGDHLSVGKSCRSSRLPLQLQREYCTIMPYRALRGVTARRENRSHNTHGE